MTLNCTACSSVKMGRAVDNSNDMKLRHSTICTLYSSTKFEALVRTKCIRRNMRSTCQWSCVLQFTWRRAVCCGLHRPMSQVILCLGLNFYNFQLFSLWYRHIWYSALLLLTKKKTTDTKHRYSELPWRNPLITNNISSFRIIVASKYQGFCFSLSLPPFFTRRSIMAYICVIHIIH